MKKLLLFLAITCLINVVYGGKVDEQKAKNIGLKFMTTNTSIKSPTKCYLAYKLTSEDGTPTLYVFNLDNKGFVVVSGEDIAIPILGYSTEGKFDVKEAPDALIEYLGGFDESIQNAVKQKVSASDEVTAQWNSIMASGHIKGMLDDTVVVAPLVTSLWNQNYPYNKMCPMDVNGPGGHVYTGCTCTAMAMLIRYWEYPRTGQGYNSYTPNGYPNQSVNYSTAVYDYSNMPTQLTTDTAMLKINQVAKLLWHCGVSINSQYGVNGTNAYPSDVPNALKTYYKYNSGTNGKSKSSYSTDQWVSMLKESLNNARPLHYSGWNSNGGNGHSFICDGYESNNYFHFNWGWNGAYNGYFALNAMIAGNYNFSYNNYTVFDAYPPEDSCSAPSNLLAVGDGTNVGLSWNASLYAKTYNIYRDTTLVATSNTNTFTDLDVEAGTYTYKVKAICKFGISDASNSIQVVVQPISNISGDANGDSQVDILDISAMIAYMLNENPTSFIFNNADVNFDGVINILDIVETTNIILNK